MDRDALVTATEAALLLTDVTRQAVAMWAARGKLQTRGMRGRSPLYRWGDVLTVERVARQTAKSTRHRDRRHGQLGRALVA